ncbi:hypothetical protein [Wenyingzhuangia sp. 2_MG-2023]|uniref:hypothetical protein n=1 Tax=Wenyingzhuangia sp. 2_MG-2023 TaxID=3062639 RepID=UPI0026E154AD|nr:hypothetical protein [Wenyingzhuangia sp. 2_MG-2023]MDO6737713.1 hypothetical protein [Wenyingzhuangia sp. 2_MG-2023]MDO6802552.1 hypothetical protein [Wenyingzhuangia sp. 1_MG-2023]
MKKLFSALKSCFILTLLFACSDDDTITSNPNNNNIVTNISINKQNAFTDEEITLTFDASNYDAITVTSEEPSINITSTSETSYTLTSEQLSSGYINITTTKDTISELNQVLVNFHEHGITDYQTIEGINIADSNIYNLLLLHGEPEGIYTQTITETDTIDNTITTTTSNFENWHYLSKGLTFRINRYLETVLSVTVYGTEWEVKLDNEENNATGVKYPYEIGDIGNFTDGILMDTVIEELGTVEDEENKIDATNSLKLYIYDDANPNLTSNQEVGFYFTSDELNEYESKNVKLITFTY